MPLLNVVKNFINSEKAVAVGVLVIAASVLMGLGKISFEQWMEYTQVLAGIYVGGKAIQGAASSMSQTKEAKAEAAAAKAELESFKTAIRMNDAAADAAAAAKPSEED